MTPLEVVEAPSPNRGGRRGGARPSLIVLHYTGMASAEAALDRLRDPEAAVSAHYLIAGDGRTWRLVPEAERAWHAGAGAWGAIEDVNSASIGIELDNPGPLGGFPPFAEAQLAVLEALLPGIMARWGIGPAGVIAHSDMAPGRKADPGPAFPWRRLAARGLALWPENAEAASVEGPPCRAAADWPRFRVAAERLGYRPHEGGWDAVLSAFRLRFRPEANGPLAGEDVACVEAMAIDAGRARA